VTVGAAGGVKVTTGRETEADRSGCRRARRRGRAATARPDSGQPAARARRSLLRRPTQQSQQQSGLSESETLLRCPSWSVCVLPLACPRRAGLAVVALPAEPSGSSLRVSRSLQLFQFAHDGSQVTLECRDSHVRRLDDGDRGKRFVPLGEINSAAPRAEGCGTPAQRSIAVMPRSSRTSTGSFGRPSDSAPPQTNWLARTASA